MHLRIFFALLTLCGAACSQGGSAMPRILSCWNRLATPKKLRPNVDRAQNGLAGTVKVRSEPELRDRSMLEEQRIREIKYAESLPTLRQLNCSDPSSVTDDVARMYAKIQNAINDYAEREGRVIDQHLVCFALGYALDEAKRVRDRLRLEGLL